MQTFYNGMVSGGCCPYSAASCVVALAGGSAVLSCSIYLPYLPRTESLNVAVMWTTVSLALCIQG